MRTYYEAYEDRYKAVHLNGASWFSEKSTPVVLEMLQKYRIGPSHKILEIGCGEGRDARAVLKQGYCLLATDISKEAVTYCKNKMPQYQDHFAVLDCINGRHHGRYDFVYAVAVIHMLVLDQDRNRFYSFIREHLAENGLALICSMGDGVTEMQSDVSRAFEPQERPHKSGKMLVAGTSCRKVSFYTFEKEIVANGLTVAECGITAALPDFDSLMFAVVRRSSAASSEESILSQKGVFSL